MIKKPSRVRRLLQTEREQAMAVCHEEDAPTDSPSTRPNTQEHTIINTVKALQPETSCRASGTSVAAAINLTSDQEKCLVDLLRRFATMDGKARLRFHVENMTRNERNRIRYARRHLLGYNNALKNVQNKSAKLVCVAKDADHELPTIQSMLRTLTDACATAGVPIVIGLTQEEYGRIMSLCYHFEDLPEYGLIRDREVLSTLPSPSLGKQSFICILSKESIHHELVGFLSLLSSHPEENAIDEGDNPFEKD